MTILDTIVAVKRREIASLRRSAFEVINQRPHRFSEALRGRDRLSLIAEVKKASPSEGVICSDFDPVALARAYEMSGAVAISVLTDSEFFQGSMEDLKKVVLATSLPVLRKDFILDEIQIYEAAEAGAAAVLLIGAILSLAELRYLREKAESLGLEALVEVHDGKELEVALESGAKIIGINNRNLATFEVDLATTLEMIIPEDVIVVSESGIQDRRDMRRLRGVVNAVLIGTSIMKCSDVSLKIHELLYERPLLKVCGIRDLATARASDEIGMDLLGFNFVEGSSRAVSSELFQHERFRAKTVGLFMDAPIELVNQVVQSLDLDLVQLHGSETFDYCEKVNCPVIKSFFPDQAPFSGVIPLFDLPKGSLGLVQPPNFKGSFGIAGGLDSNNVQKVGGESCPLFVDVARGVETEGVIDLYKVQQFFNQIQTC